VGLVSQFLCIGKPSQIILSMSLDSKFTYLNLNRVLLDLVDMEWVQDKLPDEDASSMGVPVEHLPSHDVDQLPKTKDITWTDLGLPDFV